MKWSYFRDYLKTALRLFLRHWKLFQTLWHDHQKNSRKHTWNNQFVKSTYRMRCLHFVYMFALCCDLVVRAKDFFQWLCSRIWNSLLSLQKKFLPRLELCSARSEDKQLLNNLEIRDFLRNILNKDLGPVHLNRPPSKTPFKAPISV